MPQVLRPESIGTISKVSNTQLSIGPSLANIGGQQRQTSTITVTTSTSGINGIDTGAVGASQFYYVYLVVSSGVIGAVISLSGTAPTGFPAYRLVGQCTTDGSSNLVAANQSMTDNAPVGQVLSAMLSEAQFRAIHGSGWILADGRPVTGSKYASISGNTTAPDLRGVALRGKNNGRADGNQNPDGDLALGQFQSHTYGSHSHGGATPVGGDHNHAIYARAGLGSGSYYNITNGNTNGAGAPNWGDAYAIDGTRSTSFGTVTPTHAHAINSDGGNETRMRNVTVNFFIKIN